MFKSGFDIEQKFEVFLYMCGIMEDSSPAINHMCEQFVTKVTQAPHSLFVQDRLFNITKEIRSKQRYLNPLYNDHIYYVWQLPLKRHSRLYLFNETPDWLKIGSTLQIAIKTDTNI